MRSGGDPSFRASNLFDVSYYDMVVQRRQQNIYRNTILYCDGREAEAPSDWRWATRDRRIANGSQAQVLYFSRDGPMCGQRGAEVCVARESLRRARPPGVQGSFRGGIGTPKAAHGTARLVSKLTAWGGVGDFPALRQVQPRHIAIVRAIEARAQIMVEGRAGYFLPLLTVQFGAIAFAKRLKAVLQITVVIRIGDLLLFVGSEQGFVAIARSVQASLQIMDARGLGNLLVFLAVKLRQIALADAIHAVLKVAIAVGLGDVLPLAGVQLFAIAVRETV